MAKKMQNWGDGPRCMIRPKMHGVVRTGIIPGVALHFTIDGDEDEATVFQERSE